MAKALFDANYFLYARDTVSPLVGTSDDNEGHEKMVNKKIEA